MAARMFSQDLSSLVGASVLPAPGSASAKRSASAEGSAPGTASAITSTDKPLQSLSLTQLRKKCREAGGINEKRKVEGKWIPKDKDELTL